MSDAQAVTKRLLVSKIPDWNPQWTAEQQLRWFDVFNLVLDALDSLRSCPEPRHD